MTLFTFTYSYTYAAGRLTRVYAELHVNGVFADVLGSGATEEEAREAALERWRRIPFDVLVVTGGPAAGPAPRHGAPGTFPGAFVLRGAAGWCQGKGSLTVACESRRRNPWAAGHVTLPASAWPALSCPERCRSGSDGSLLDAAP
jgi:hypothetical protein